MGENSIGKVISNMMAEAGYEGFFSGHCLRCTRGSRLFQAGVQHNLIKECTGHASDPVDAYQITSDKQCSTISKILPGNGPTAPTCGSNNLTKVARTTTDVLVNDPSKPPGTPLNLKYLLAPVGVIIMLKS